MASNRNRFDPDSPLTKWFVASIQWQSYRNFELIIADGESNNYETIKNYMGSNAWKIPMRIVQYPIGEQFHRSLLNNVGIRHASSPFVMTTDVDMIFHKDFMDTLMQNVHRDRLVESRTLYMKSEAAQQIHHGIIDPYTQWDQCKIGRIKKRTTAGGCQCMRIDRWHELRGFDESYIGWGSEDQDLVLRAQKLGLQEIWMGESAESIMLLHQPHDRDVKKDLAAQDINKLKLLHIRNYAANSGSWGGMKG